jgi:hypothetical protein
MQAGAGVDNLGSECYAAVVGVGAPNTADKEDRISLSDAVECGEEVFRCGERRFQENAGACRGQV